MELWPDRSRSARSKRLHQLEPRQYVKGWLQGHREEIANAEAVYGIDRRAIAGATNEALENVYGWTGFGFARWRGPGKVHYKEGYFSEGVTMAAEVEERGMVPWGEQTMAERRRRVANTADSITYIAAIMKLFADEAAEEGIDISRDPALLTTFYNAWNIDEAEEKFQSGSKAGWSPNPMGEWVQENMDYIESAVGSSGLPAKETARELAAHTSKQANATADRSLLDIQAEGALNLLTGALVDAERGGVESMRITLTHDGDRLRYGFENRGSGGDPPDRSSERAAEAIESALGNYIRIVREGGRGQYVIIYRRDERGRMAFHEFRTVDGSRPDR